MRFASQVWDAVRAHHHVSPSKIVLNILLIDDELNTDRIGAARRRSDVAHEIGDVDVLSLCDVF